MLDRLVTAGIENIIALRGDPPAGQTRFETPPDGFAHASDLIAFIRRAIRRTGCAWPAPPTPRGTSSAGTSSATSPTW